MDYFESMNESFGFKSLLTNIDDFMGYSKLPIEQRRSFKALIMEYCQKNLAKLEVYIPSPYVTKYILDEVRDITLSG